LVVLSEVNYADSSGLGALLFGLRQLKNLGGQLKLLGAKNRVFNLIKIARLENYLPNFDDKKAAIESFKAD
jgi:anti-anti-sigma factor